MLDDTVGADPSDTLPASGRPPEGVTVAREQGRGLVVRKVAPAGGEPRLDREVALLRHLDGLAVPVPLGPEPPPGVGERFGYAGPRTLHDAATLDPSVLVATLATVATVLADAHDRGVSHGRVEAGHVLVGDTGRAVLTGWADAGVRDDVEAMPGVGPGPQPFDPAADVAAFGALVEHTARVADLPPGRARTHLTAVTTAARHPDPTIRPPARELARVLDLAAATATGPSGRAPDPAPGRRVLIGAIAAAAGALVTIVAVTSGGTSRPASTPSAVALAAETDAGTGLGSGDGADDFLEDRADPVAGTDLDPDRAGRTAPTGDDRGGAAIDRSPRSGPATSPVSTCPITPEALALAGLPAPCVGAAIVEGAVVTLGPLRFALGDPGDVAGLSDPTCSGRLRPTLLRPSSGRVYLFDTWATAGRPVTGRLVGTVPDAAALADPTGLRCGPIGVVRPDGSIAELTGAGA